VSGGTLQIASTISNSGTFTATGGTIEFNGSSAQTVPAGVFATSTIGGLTANNAAGVTLSGTLNVSGIVKATTGNLNTGGYLTLLSTASQTALIDGSGAGEVLGNVTMKRYLDTGYGYRYVSSPFTAATVSGFSGLVNLSATFPAFYSYDESVSYSGWVTDTVPSSVLTPLHGYAANFGSSFASQTISLTGVVNNHTISSTLYNHNNTYTLGFNLVGNPYPSPLDWNASSGWTKTNIDNAVYYFNKGDTNQYYGTYSSYVGGISSDGIANNIIPAMQGFFVHVSNGSYPVTGTLSVNNPARVNNLTPFYHKPTGNIKPLIRVDAGLSTGARKDPAVIYFDDAATDSFDNSLDALKIINTDASVPSLYAIGADGNHLSIQASRPSQDTLRFIPLGIQVQQDGIVTFSARDLDNLPGDVKVFFYDAKTGATKNMTTKEAYSVTLGSGTYDSRFFLLYTNKDTVNLPGFSAGLNAWYGNGILNAYNVAGSSEIVITDMAGRVVQRSEVNGNGYHQLPCNLSPSVYLVTLDSDMGRQSKKMLLGK